MLDWGDWSTIINSSILLFTILGLATLGGYFCERVGIINIAIDGQMIFGALIFFIFAQILSPLGNGTFIIPMILAMLFSFSLSSLFGYLVIKLKCNHVIAGTAINLLLAGITIFINNPLGASISGGLHQKLYSGYISKLQISNYLTGEPFIILAIVILIIAIVSFVIYKTRFGLRFKAVGDNPNAVDAQGLNVNKYKWYGIFISGILTALAGAIFAYGSTSIGGTQYFEGNVMGLGFLALAIIVAGAWKIPMMILFSFVFALLVRIFENEGILGFIGNVPNASSDVSYIKYIGKSLPFVLSLIALAIFSRKAVAPQSLGQHFDKSIR